MSRAQQLRDAVRAVRRCELRAQAQRVVRVVHLVVGRPDDRVARRPDLRQGAERNCRIIASQVGGRMKPAGANGIVGNRSGQYVSGASGGIGERKVERRLRQFGEGADRRVDRCGTIELEEGRRRRVGMVVRSPSHERELSVRRGDAELVPFGSSAWLPARPNRTPNCLVLPAASDRACTGGSKTESEVNRAVGRTPCNAFVVPQARADGSPGSVTPATCISRRT